MAGGAYNLPVSQILKDKTKHDEEPKKKSREDWRKAKELEEARKAGTAPAAVDEEGRDINPHIPQYISTAPWYYGTTGPTLKHQRPQEEKQKEFSGIDEWYKRGVDTVRHDSYIVFFNALIFFFLIGESFDEIPKRCMRKLRSGYAQEKGMHGTTAKSWREVQRIQHSG